MNIFLEAADILSRVTTTDKYALVVRSLIESSGEKAVPASDRLTVPCENAPTIKKDLTVEVEEAMETLTMLVKVDGDVLENAALAVIRAALSKGIEVEP